MPPKKDNIKGIVTTCSVGTVTGAMGKLRKKMTKEQWDAVKRTPFYHFLNSKALKASVAWVEAILGRYDRTKKAFVLENGVEFKHDALEFCCVLGLHHGGQRVQQKLVLTPRVAYRYFEGKLSNMDRKNLLQVLESLAGREDVVEDFARIYVLLVFNCILFPTINRSTLEYVVHHVDDLDRLGMYAWGKAAYIYLERCIDDYTSGKRYIAGCTMGLVAWFFERLPELGTPIQAPCFPRFCRWANIQPDIETCQTAIAKLTKEDLDDFITLPEEEQFLHAKPVEKKGEFMKWKGRSEDQVPVPVPEEEEEAREEDDDVEVEKDEEDKEEEEAGEEDEEGKAGEEEEEYYERGQEVDDRLVEAGEKENNDEGEGTGEESDGEAARRELRSKRTHDRREGKAVDENVGCTSLVKRVIMRRDRRARKMGADFVTPSSSSIPARKKGKKIAGNENPTLIEIDESMYSSSNDLLEKEQINASKYRRRRNYAGHDLIPTETRQYIKEYLSAPINGLYVWTSGVNVILPSNIIDVLFDKAIGDVVINAWLEIISSNEWRALHNLPKKIAFLSTHTSRTIWEYMSKRKRSGLRDKDYPEFLNDMVISARDELLSLGNQLQEGVKYIILPLHDQEYPHWHMLIFNLETMKIISRNSLPARRGCLLFRQRTALLFIMSNFIAWLLRCAWGVKLPLNCDEVPVCREQMPDSNDCGIFVCMWSEGYARDSEDWWEHVEPDINIKKYRAELAVTILQDSHRVLNC